MSGVMGFGPREENETTLGAMTSFQVSPTRIVAIGFLKNVSIPITYKVHKMAY